MEHSNDHSGHDHHIAMFKQRFFVSLFFTLPILALSPLVQRLLGYTLSFPGDGYAQVALASALFFYGGWPFLTGLVSELRNRRPGMMTLISIAITVAYAFSVAVVFGLPGEPFFWELATLITIMLAGHWIEMRAVSGAQRAIESISKLLPDTARVIDDGEREVKVSELTSGMRVRIKPGERVPADGRIIEGSGSFDESVVTGESAPVERVEGEVVAGSTLVSGSVDIEVTAEEGSRYLDRVTELVSGALEEKSRMQRFADRAAGWLAYAGVAAGLITFAAWMTITGDLTLALRRTAGVLIIACPHALGLAIPLVVSVSTAKAARAGVIIRNRTAFENAHSVRSVVFDKTGTLTHGRMDLVRIDADDEEEALRIAAALESRSEHPIGDAIVAEAEKRGIDVPEAKNFSSERGTGVSGTVGRTKYRIVSPKAARSHGIELDLEGSGAVLLKGDERLATFVFQDTPRSEAKNAVKKLASMGISAIMLTGDNEREAQRIAQELGIERVIADVSPEEKQEEVAKLERAMMVGDGVNDAPALAKAQVSCAIGSGTDVAAQSADIILASDDPRRVPWIIEFSRTVRRKTVQNLWWAAGYNIIAIPLAAGVLAPWGFVIEPALGAAIMSASTVIVALNAQTLRRFSEKL